MCWLAWTVLGCVVDPTLFRVVLNSLPFHSQSIPIWQLITLVLPPAFCPPVLRASHNHRLPFLKGKSPGGFGLGHIPPEWLQSWQASPQATPLFVSSSLSGGPQDYLTSALCSSTAYSFAWSSYWDKTQTYSRVSLLPFPVCFQPTQIFWSSGSLYVWEKEEGGSQQRTGGNQNSALGRH